MAIVKLRLIGSPAAIAVACAALPRLLPGEVEIDGPLASRRRNGSGSVRAYGTWVIREPQGQGEAPSPPPAEEPAGLLPEPGRRRRRR